MTYEYYFTVLTDAGYKGICYKLNYKLDNTENMLKIMEQMKDEGYQNPTILFFKQLNE